MGMERGKQDQNIQWRRLKTLVVDDYPDFIRTVRGMLLSLGLVNVDTATSGVEAVRLMTVRRYDIVLCDYNLGPGQDGQQVLEEARHRRLLLPTAIFMMVTAENTLEMIMGAAEYEPDAYLIKPFTGRTLHKKIQNLLEKKEALKPIDRAIRAMDYERALGLCEELIARRPPFLADLLRIKGDVLLMREDYEGAKAFFKEVSTLGRLPWAVLGLGRLKLREGDHEGAKRVFAGLIAMNDKVMSAYDELARTMEATGEYGEAKETLLKATEISPKAIKRQETLGRVALRGGDLATAERCFRETVKLGRHSCFKSPSHYTSLAAVLTEKGAPEEALKVLQEGGEEFPRDADAAVRLTIARSLVYTRTGQHDKARECVSEALEMVKKNPQAVERDVTLDLAKALMTTGDEELGKEILRRTVQNNHDDAALLEGVKAVFREAGREEEGERLLEEAVEEVVAMNNEGVRLVRGGDLETAITYFAKATERLPENKLVNANAAYAFLAHMKEKGADDALIVKVRTYLSRIHRLDPTYRDLPKLAALYREITNEAPPWTTDSD